MAACPGRSVGGCCRSVDPRGNRERSYLGGNRAKTTVVRERADSAIFVTGHRVFVDSGALRSLDTSGKTGSADPPVRPEPVARSSAGPAPPRLRLFERSLFESTVRQRADDVAAKTFDPSISKMPFG